VDVVVGYRVRRVLEKPPNPVVHRRGPRERRVNERPDALLAVRELREVALREHRVDEQTGRAAGGPRIA
jgi:hypothetical protein